jgi:hypothetical protein
VNLGEERDVGPLVERLDRGAHPCAAGANDEHVVRRFHCDGRYRMEAEPGLVTTGIIRA